MKGASDAPNKPATANAWAWLWMGVAHAVAVVCVAILMALVVFPVATLEALIRAHATVPQLMERSLPAFALHMGLSACLWALVVIVFQLWRRPRPKLVRALGRRGSVMAETLIVLPLFLFLTFGMAQLAVNNMGGILANVAVYQAARAAWLWKPEVGVQRVSHKMTDKEVKDRARIAAAEVMTPVAPGAYLSNPTGSDAFKKTRFALAAGQVPMGGALGGAGSLLATVGSVSPKLATRNNLSLTTALGTSSFLRRSLLKFTHAYEATSVKITQKNKRVGVKLTYQLHEVMPVANHVFGKFKKVGWRLGYFLTIKREYTFRQQPYSANGSLPDGSFKGKKGSSNGGSLGDVGAFKF